MVLGLDHLLESAEVRLGPELAGHLPRCCRKADMGAEEIHRDNITHVGSSGPLEASRGLEKAVLVCVYMCMCVYVNVYLFVYTYILWTTF